MAAAASVTVACTSSSLWLAGWLAGTPCGRPDTDHGSLWLLVTNAVPALFICSTSIPHGLTAWCQPLTTNHTTPYGRCMSATMLNCPASLGAAST